MTSVTLKCRKCGEACSRSDVPPNRFVHDEETITVKGLNLTGKSHDHEAEPDFIDVQSEVIR